MNDIKHDQKLNLTILVNGEPVTKDYPPTIKVIDVIRDLLSAGEKQNTAAYQLVDRNIGPAALDPNMTLAEAGVKNNDTLSLTKKDGGGG